MNDFSDDLRAQLELEAELGGWQVYRATVSTSWLDRVDIPAGHYYASHWLLSEPPIVAADLETLRTAVLARQVEMAIAEHHGAPVELDGHLPRRPTWNCMGCGSPWPCELARGQLAQTMMLGRLVGAMAALQGDASSEACLSPAEACDRFTGWI